MTDKYQGWANYETWLVNLWLSNEQETYHEFRDLAREFDKDHMYEFGQEIKARVETEIERLLNNLESGPYSGIIKDSANLAGTDWQEIAEAFKEDWRPFSAARMPLASWLTACSFR